VLELNKLYNMDCLEGMKMIENSSVDMVFADLPYGTTACKWDSIIDLNSMWKELNRIVKPNGAMVFTASQPFTTTLMASNIKQFRVEWIYEKAVGSNFATVKYQPMKEHESVLVFSQKTPVNYYPIMQKRKGKGLERVLNPYHTDSTKGNECVGGMKRTVTKGEYSKLRNPSSVQYFNNRAKGDRGLHPTQKPVELCEYFIKTYTAINDLVLDICVGSGTTAVACLGTGRNYIGFEISKEYYDTATKRLEAVKSQVRFTV
jgi:site-specific DNA-methyltransferase (adenine-specific)